MAPGSYCRCESGSGGERGRGKGVEAPISSAFSKRLVFDVAQEIGNAVGKCKVINTVIDRFILGSSIPLQLEQIIPTSSLPTDNRNSAVASGDELEKHLGN